MKTRFLLLHGVGSTRSGEMKAAVLEVFGATANAASLEELFWNAALDSDEDSVVASPAVPGHIGGLLNWALATAVVNGMRGAAIAMRLNLLRWMDKRHRGVPTTLWQTSDLLWLTGTLVLAAGFPFYLILMGSVSALIPSVRHAWEQSASTLPFDTLVATAAICFTAAFSFSLAAASYAWGISSVACWRQGLQSRSFGQCLAAVLVSPLSGFLWISFKIVGILNILATVAISSRWCWGIGLFGAANFAYLQYLLRSNGSSESISLMMVSVSLTLLPFLGLAIYYPIALGVQRLFGPSLKVLSDIFCYVGNPTYRKQLLKLLETKWTTASSEVDEIVICAHSLGTVLAVDCLLNVVAARPDLRVVLVTGGSPLRRFFFRFFPRLFFPDDAQETARLVEKRFKSFAWHNVYRPLDYIGGNLGLPNSSATTDDRLRQRWRLHTGYWNDPLVASKVRDRLAMQAAYPSIPARRTKKGSRLSILAPRLITAKRSRWSWSWAEFKRWKLLFFVGLCLVSMVQGYQGLLIKKRERWLFRQQPTLEARLWIFPIAQIPSMQGRARLAYHGNFAIPTNDGREVIVRGGVDDGRPYGEVRASYPGLLRFAQQNGRRGTEAGFSVDSKSTENKSRLREDGWIVDRIRLAKSIDRDPPMYYAVDFPTSEKLWLGVVFDAVVIVPLGYLVVWVLMIVVWQLALWLGQRLVGVPLIALRLGRPHYALDIPAAIPANNARSAE